MVDGNIRTEARSWFRRAEDLRMRSLFPWLSVVLLAFLSGCSSGPSNPATTPGGRGPEGTPAKRGTIGVSLLTLENPFFKVIGDHITAEGKKYGYDTIVLS